MSNRDEMAAEFARLGEAEKVTRVEQHNPRATPIELSFGGVAPLKRRKKKKTPNAPTRVAADPTLLTWVDCIYRRGKR